MKYAQEKLGIYGEGYDDGYSLNSNNCQHFVCMARNGFAESYEANQIRNNVAAAAGISAGILIATNLLKKWLV